MNRRNFVKNGLFAMGSTGTLSFPNSKDQPAKPAILKTDTHVHFFDLQKLKYSWLKNAPEINRDFDLDDYRAATEKANIGKMLFMESGADAGLGVKEARLVSAMVAKEPRIKGIIAKLDISRGEALRPDLEALVNLNLVKGIRSQFPDEAATSPAFLAGMRMLQDQRMTFDLLVSPGRLGTARQLAKACPNNTFILDHLGNPTTGADGMSVWKAGIRALAELPNVHCKISGIITRIGKDWKTRDLRPYIQFAIEQFGVDRLVYGGDWPVVLRAGSYQSWSRAFEKITKALTVDERAKVFHGNADRIYNLV